MNVGFVKDIKFSTRNKLKSDLNTEKSVPSHGVSERSAGCQHDVLGEKNGD